MLDKLSLPLNLQEQHILFNLTLKKWGGLFIFYSSPNIIRMILLACLSNQGICAKMESVKENYHVNDSIGKATVRCFFISKASLNAALLKLGVKSKGFQTAGPRSASQWRLFIETETSYDTSTSRG